MKTPAPAPLGCSLTPVQRKRGRPRRKGRDRQGSISQPVRIRALPTFCFLTKRALNFLWAVSRLYTSSSPSQPIRRSHHPASSLSFFLVQNCHWSHVLSWGTSALTLACVRASPFSPPPLRVIAGSFPSSCTIASLR